MTGISTHVPPRPRPEILDAKCKCGHLAAEHLVTPGDLGLHIGSCIHLTGDGGILGAHEACPCGEFEHVPFVTEPSVGTEFRMSAEQWAELRTHLAAVDRILQSVARTR